MDVHISRASKTYSYLKNSMDARANNYEIHVQASGQHTSRREEYDSLPPGVQFYFNFLVEQTYHSSDRLMLQSRRYIDVIKKHKSPEFSYESIMSDHDHNDPFWGILSGIISDDLNLPFVIVNGSNTSTSSTCSTTTHDVPLIQWTGVMCDAGRVEFKKEQLENNHEDLIRHILDFTRWTLPRLIISRRRNAYHVVFINVEIGRKVILPPDQFEAFVRSREREERVHKLNQMVSGLTSSNSFSFEFIEMKIEHAVIETAPKDKANLDKNYERNLRLSLIDQAIRELVDSDRGDIVQAVPATRLTIEALEKVKFEGGGGGECSSGYEYCTICMDHILIGSIVSSMPCFHMYHSHCIAKWLKISNSCPVCRCKLPIL